jgi:hypothetical protein
LIDRIFWKPLPMHGPKNSSMIAFERNYMGYLW